MNGPAISHATLMSRVGHEQTIPRQLAHKRRLENVYVTSLEQLGESEFLFGAFVPQSNVHLNALRSFPGDVTLALIEIGRQFGLAISHRFLGVPPGMAFVLNDMRFEVCSDWRSIDWRTHETVWGRARFHDHRYSPSGELLAVRAEGHFHVGERPLCLQASNWTIQPLDRYRRLREMTRTRRLRRRDAQPEVLPIVDAQRVLASTQRRRVIEPELAMDAAGLRYAARLRVDRDNLFFFDHDNDHVPGMLILEGMRRLVLDIAARERAAGRRHSRMRAMDIGFRDFAELDDAVQLIAELRRDGGAGADIIDVEARQSAAVLASGRFELE